MVGAGVTTGGPAAVRLAQRPRHGGAARRDGASAGVDRLVLASSMVVYGDGALRVPEHGAQPASRVDCARPRGRATSRSAVPGAAAHRWPGGWSTRTHADPAQQLCREQAGAGALRRGLGRQLPGAAVALRYHNVYGPGMPRDTPYSGVAAIFRSAIERASRRGSSRTVGRCGTSCTSATSPRPTRWRSSAVADAARRHVRGIQRLLGSADLDRRGGRAAVARGAGRRASCPSTTGEFRAGDVRHIVASPDARPRRARLRRLAVSPERRPAEFATAPLRG